MDDFDDIEYDRESANSEIRYLTLELMKIAIRKNKSFEEVAQEFIRNVYYMRDLISKIEDLSKSKDSHERKHQKSNKPY